jgi:hypothetical protein
MNKVDCWVPHALLKAIVRAFLTTKFFTAGSSMYSCHMACVLKSVPKDVISLSNYVPNGTEAPWMGCTIAGADYSTSLSCVFLGHVHKVVLLWFCFHCIR